MISYKNAMALASLKHDIYKNAMKHDILQECYALSIFKTEYITRMLSLYKISLKHDILQES